MTVKGRPRKKIEKLLLEAAATEFLEKGYMAANLDHIVAAAGTTKPAFYRRYSGKLALFEAVLEHLALEFQLDLDFLGDTQRAPADTLYELAGIFYHRLGSPRVMAMSRLGVAESNHFPELILRFRQGVMAGFIGKVTEYLGCIDEQGVVTITDTLVAAINFLTLSGRVHERLMGVELRAEQVEPYLREVVRFFLAGYGPTADQPTG
ncbi:hypothetical protein CK507_16540 [Pseudomonas sp. WN033]|nr:hypothetical protein CK507_16540 [Pseudomonas sp. WN033]